MATIPKTRKKLRECAFFFKLMTDFAGRSTALDREDFVFLLSAFLSAARSVTFVLQAEERALYSSWFSKWSASLSDSDRGLMRFMNDQRVAEVHSRGASVETKIEMLPIIEIHTRERPSHPAYGMHSSGPPGTPVPTVGIPVDYFEREGPPERAVNTCRQYLQMLQTLVDDFENAAATLIVGRPGIQIPIPGFGDRDIRTIVSDYTGTLSRSGRLVSGIKERLQKLAKLVNIVILTSDSFGTADGQLKGIDLERLPLPVDYPADIQKKRLVENYDLAHVAAFGNGNNDRLMLKTVKEAGGLAIAVDNGEGCALDTLLNANLVIVGAANALDLLLEGTCCKATLRY